MSCTVNSTADPHVFNHLFSFDHRELQILQISHQILSLSGQDIRMHFSKT